MATKRKYEEKLLKRLGAHESFLLERMRKEWDVMERSKRREGLLNMTKQTGRVVGWAILAIAALGGVAVIATVAPNIFAAFGKMGGHRRFIARRGLRDQLSYLRRQGYARIKEEGDGDTIAEVRLTEFGRRSVIARAFGELKIIPQDAWDEKWRMVIFDIPDKHKYAREGLREKLKRMGFYALQKSVFVLPYPCEEEIQFLTNLYDIGRYVRMIETDSIQPDGDLLKKFALKYNP